MDLNVDHGGGDNHLRRGTLFSCAAQGDTTGEVVLVGRLRRFAFITALRRCRFLQVRFATKKGCGSVQFLHEPTVGDWGSLLRFCFVGHSRDRAAHPFRVLPECGCPILSGAKGGRRRSPTRRSSTTHPREKAYRLHGRCEHPRGPSTRRRSAASLRMTRVCIFVSPFPPLQQTQRWATHGGN